MNFALRTTAEMRLADFSIPESTMPEWTAMPVGERYFIAERLGAMREIVSAETVCDACRAVAARHEAKGERGWSFPTLYRLYDAFVKSNGDWRTLKRDYRGRHAGLPEAFAEFFRELLLKSPRRGACRAAHRELIARWMRGESIPGMGDVYEWSARTGRPVPKVWPSNRELPDGMSYRNLSRIKPRNKYAEAVAKRGFAAAHSDEPAMLLRDRSALRPLEVITFDDVRIDNRCLIAAEGLKREIGYPLAVLALDVGTGCDIAHCVKPRSTREDGTTFGIASEEVRCLILNIIETYGLPPYAMHFLIENAAATLSRADELALTQTFGERIKIHRCGLMKDRFLESGFYESGGKPWCKGWIESFFNALQAQLSLADGASGNRYDNNPAALRGAEQYSKWILRLTEGRDDILARLKLPNRRFEEVCDDIVAALNLLRNRKDHSLQGFDTVTEWRRDKTDCVRASAELAKLTDAETASVEIWDRPESPAERMARLCADIKFWRPDVAFYAHLYLLKQETTFAISNGGLTFRAGSLKRHKCEKITDALVFESPPYGTIEKLTGKTVLVYFDDDLSMAHIAHNGVYVCSVRRRKRVNMADEKAILAESGRVHQRRLADRNVIEQLMPERAAKLADMRRHNCAELEAAGLLAGKMRAAADANKRNNASRRRAIESLDISEICEAEATTIVSESEGDDFDPSNPPEEFFK